MLTSLNIADVINNNINNKINYYRYTFDIPTEIEMQKDMEDILKNKKNPQYLLPTFHRHY